MSNSVKNELKIQNSTVKNIFQIIIDFSSKNPIIFFMSILSLFIVILYSYPWKNYSIQSGDINIALGNFLLFEDGKLINDKQFNIYSDMLYDQLDLFQEELEQERGLIVDLRSSDEIPSFTSSSIVNMTNKAVAYAQKINADILLYGYIENTIYGIEIHPYIYLNEAKFGDIWEVVGDHKLGSVLYERTNNILDINGRLLSRKITCLAKLIYPLSEYIVGNYEIAINGYEGLLEADCQQIIPTDLLFILIGNAYSRTDNLDCAESFYVNALQYNPSYCRGYLGLAGIHYLVAYDSTKIGDLQVALQEIKMTKENLNKAMT